MLRRKRWIPVGLVVSILAGATVEAAVSREQVEKGIKLGVRFLKQKQRADGSWLELQDDAKTGQTSLITLALLTAGEPADSPEMSKALSYLGKFTPDQLDSTYSVALQTMVFAAADPKRFNVKITDNVNWLEQAQLKPGERFGPPGAWAYKRSHTQQGDNSNSQYALLGLNAASEVGVAVNKNTWELARKYWEIGQHLDGSWAYHQDSMGNSSGSMSCAGISSLIITGLKRFQGLEAIEGDHVINCGKGGINPRLQRAVDWMAANFRVGDNIGQGSNWKFYYLYGLERAGRLTGQRFFGGHDWYREGAEELISIQDPLQGSWRGQNYVEGDPLIATSFALLFLAKGRSPVLINKLRHGPGNDWSNDPDDIRNLVSVVSTDWKHLLTWQVVDPNFATVEDLLQAPILYFNGHEAPVFTNRGKENLREYVEQGGFIFAEACCGKANFDTGFKALMKELFPEPEYDLHPLADDHAIWRARHPLTPDVHPLWGIEHGCRTVVIYSPGDLSCYWNLMESNPGNAMVVKAQRVGQNVVDYATGRELPADKLTVREVKNFKSEPPKRGALRIAKLKHAGDWNVAPLAIPNLTATLKEKLQFDVVINHYELVPKDPNLINYPLIYIHGRAALSFTDEDKQILRRHLEPGGGTLFADAACGSPAFDAAFRKFCAELAPDSALVPIPKEDVIYTKKVGFDLANCRLGKAAGGGEDFPQLEGVKIDGRWAVIYSKFDIGCALERHSGLDCKGYTYESAMRIAANIVLYATLPGGN